MFNSNNPLSLIYESSIIPTNRIRTQMIDDVLYLESCSNDEAIHNMIPYLTEAEKSTLATEGLWDRMKARGAQAIGSAKGAYQQGKGAINNTVGQAQSYAGNKAAQIAGGDPNQSTWVQNGNQKQLQGNTQIAQGKMQGTEAKLDSFTKSIVQTVYKDLNKLGIKLNDPTGKQFMDGMQQLFQQSFALIGSEGQEYQYEPNNAQ